MRRDGRKFSRFDDDRKFRRFDRKRFGRFDDDDGDRFRRFRHRHGRFVHFHDGWWYDTPWWTVGLAAYPAYAGYGDAHTQWCLARYRSYNPANNTFVSYSGEIRECVSPYGP